MEELLLTTVADQLLDCNTTTTSSNDNRIVRMAYPDPSSTIAACEPSVVGAKSCWTVASQLELWSYGGGGTDNNDKDAANRQVMQVIRYEFDFGTAVQKVIPNNVLIELLGAPPPPPTGKDPANHLSNGAAVGLSILCVVLVLAVGAYVKVQRWKSVNTRMLTHQTKGSHRRSAVEGFFPGGWSSDDDNNVIAAMMPDNQDDEESSDDDDDDDDGSDGYEASELGEQQQQSQPQQQPYPTAFNGSAPSYRAYKRCYYGGGKSIDSSDDVDSSFFGGDDDDDDGDDGDDYESILAEPIVAIVDTLPQKQQLDRQSFC
mmetsp:Transcript_5677/g.9408  ORF Transcript_5677/g.9408 Transcript_5677/m.9408 type:complete len:316 (+) Transcript_5677:1438-2385(+)